MTGETPIRIMCVMPIDACYGKAFEIINLLPDFQLTGAFTNPEQTSIERIAGCCDIVLIHQQYSQPGNAFVNQLAEQRMRFIVTDTSSDPANLARHLEAGASGYITAEDSDDAIQEVIHDVYTGNFQTDPYVTDALLRDFRRFSATCRVADIGSNRLAQSQSARMVQPGIKRCPRRIRHIPRSTPHWKHCRYPFFNISDLCLTRRKLNDP